MMIRYQPAAPRPHEGKLQELRHERKIEDQRLAKLTQILMLKFTPVKTVNHDAKVA
jgi:hypothetical protein